MGRSIDTDELESDRSKSLGSLRQQDVPTSKGEKDKSDSASLSIKNSKSSSDSRSGSDLSSPKSSEKKKDRGAIALLLPKAEAVELLNANIINKLDELYRRIMRRDKKINRLGEENVEKESSIAALKAQLGDL